MCSRGSYFRIELVSTPLKCAEVSHDMGHAGHAIGTGALESNMEYGKELSIRGMPDELG